MPRVTTPRWMLPMGALVLCLVAFVVVSFTREPGGRIAAADVQGAVEAALRADGTSGRASCFESGSDRSWSCRLTQLAGTRAATSIALRVGDDGRWRSFRGPPLAGCCLEAT